MTPRKTAAPASAGASAVPDLLTTADIAALVGVEAPTIRSYVARGVMPQPDGHLGRTPYWHRRTIHDWLATRPGQGKGGGRPRKTTEKRD